jgi:hypothetical protein
MKWSLADGESNVSFPAILWAWSAPTESTRKLVLLALADHANRDGVAWPSLRRIAARTGLSERTVQYALRDLQEEGHIRRVRKPGARTRAYCLALSSSDSADSKPQRMQAPGAVVAGDSCIPCVSTPASDAPKPTISNNKIEETTIRTYDVNAPDWNAFNVFFEEYPRKEAREAAKRAFPAAAEAAGGADALLKALKNYEFSCDPRYVPYAVTWLRDRRWLDIKHATSQQRKLGAAGTSRFSDWRLVHPCAAEEGSIVESFCEEIAR